MTTIRNINLSPVWQVFDGIQRQVLAYGEHSTFARHVLETGAVIPKHNHPEEQITTVIKGKLRVVNGENGEEVLTVAAGDSWTVPPNIPHEITALEPSEAYDFFAPPRQDYIQELHDHENNS